MKFRYLLLFLLTAFIITYVSYNLFGDYEEQVTFMGIMHPQKFVDEFNDSYVADIKETGKLVEYNLVASPTEINFLGDVNTEVWAYNNQIPGPTLKVKLGDTLRVNFTNNLSQDTTIHWHGVRVPNAMDGVPGVTQDLIAPGDSFVYEFIPKDAGTFWFHPHNRSSEQVERGLYGVLIVEDVDEPQYSQDLILVVDDWRIDRDGQINENFNSGHDLMHDGRWGNIITVNSIINPSFPVAHGERIRLRLINVSNARIYKPNFLGLSPRVIAIDGMKVKENFNLTNLDLAPGNRIDLDIIIPINTELDKIELVDSFTRNKQNLAYLDIIPQVVDTPDFDILNNDNIPSWFEADTLTPNVVLNLNAKRQGMQIKWTINDQVYPDIERIILKANTFNKILINNESSRLHPMHLHGQFFKVLSRNGIKVSEDYWMDTVLVKARESVEIGLVPLDKGSWLNHCHALEHAEAGMMTIIEVI